MLAYSLIMNTHNIYQYYKIFIMTRAFVITFFNPPSRVLIPHLWARSSGNVPTSYRKPHNCCNRGGDLQSRNKFRHRRCARSWRSRSLRPETPMWPPDASPVAAAIGGNLTQKVALRMQSSSSLSSPGSISISISISSRLRLHLCGSLTN